MPLAADGPPATCMGAHCAPCHVQTRPKNSRLDWPYPPKVRKMRSAIALRTLYVYAAPYGRLGLQRIREKRVRTLGSDTQTSQVQPDARDLDSFECATAGIRARSA